MAHALAARPAPRLAWRLLPAFVNLVASLWATWPLARVVDASGAMDTASLASLVAADRRYLQTLAGQWFTAVWQPGAVRTDSLRTFFLVSQGYYVEWIRRGWLAEPRRHTPFVPNDSSLAEAVARYRVVKDTLEQRFAATRVPVR